MKPKQFLGRDISEALSAVRRSLGPDALILQSRSVAAGNGVGIEVTAMNEEADEIQGETVNRGNGESENQGEKILRFPNSPAQLTYNVLFARPIPA